MPKLYNDLTRAELIAKIFLKNNNIPQIHAMPDYQIVAIYIDEYNCNID